MPGQVSPAAFDDAVRKHIEVRTKVSQRAFDELVQENMQEFEMTAEEAVEDAVAQFESQGADLSQIVKAAKHEDERHEVEKMVDRVTQLMDDVTALTKALVGLKMELGTESQRSMAGTNGGVDVSVKALASHVSSGQVCAGALAVLVNLMLVADNRDFLRENGVNAVVAAAKKHKDDPDIMTLVFKCLRNSCVKHETNRGFFMNQNIAPFIVQSIRDHQASDTVVDQACACVRILTQDDDMRHQCGSAHENAKSLVEMDATTVFLDILSKGNASKNTVASLFSALSRLAVRNEFCEMMMENGGMAIALKTLGDHEGDAKLVRHVLSFIKALAGNDECRKVFGEDNCCALVVQAMAALASDVNVCEYSFGALTALTLRSPENSKRVIAAGGAREMVRAMRMHAGAVGVQRAACMALRNMAARDREGHVKQAILDEHAEPVIRAAMAAHARCADVGKGALRDLGADIVLTEEWKGQANTMAS